MPTPQPTPQNPDPLMRPVCPNCSTLMVLTQINPAKPGFETGFFYCPRCGYAETKGYKIP